MGLGAIIDGAVFPTKWSQAQFFMKCRIARGHSWKTWQRSSWSGIFLEGVLLPSAEKRVKQEPVPYTHENVTFLKRRFAAFDGKKKVTKEPVPYMGENISAVRLAFMA